MEKTRPYLTVRIPAITLTCPIKRLLSNRIHVKRCRYKTCVPDFQSGTQTCQPSRFWRDSPAFLPDVPRPAKSWKCPAFCTKSDFFLARVQFVTLPRCPDVNANHPIERNYGNSVRFLSKIPNGTAAESPCYSVFWNAIDFCRLYTSKKNLNVGPAKRPAFCRQVPLFYANCPSKNILQVGRSGHCGSCTRHVLKIASLATCPIN